jgi:hypothetical protein
VIPVLRVNPVAFAIAIIGPLPARWSMASVAGLAARAAPVTNSLMDFLKAVTADLMLARRGPAAAFNFTGLRHVPLAAQNGTLH